MDAVAIVGAGELGATIAQTLARAGRTSEIRLIDEAVSVAAGKALDIRQSGPLEASDAQISAHAELGAAIGARVVIVADRVSGGAGEWTGEAGLALLKRLRHQDPASILLCAGAMQRDLIQRGVFELGIARQSLVGSAPEALVSAVRALVALEANVSASAVSISVVGVPPDRAVVSWSEAAIAGYALTSVLSPPQLTRLSRRVPTLWPPGPYTLASAAAAAVRAVIAGSTRVFCCFVALDGELGVRRVACALPVMLGSQGLDRTWTPKLSVQEQVLLDNAVGGRA